MQYTTHGYPYPNSTDPVDALRQSVRESAIRTEKDRAQPATTFTYDAQNRVTQVVEKLTDGTTVRTTNFTYDATTGRLLTAVELLDGRTETTTFSYNGQGFLAGSTVTVA